MIEDFMRLASESGIMVALFVGLLVFVLRDTKRREEKYHEMITELHDSLKVVRDIHNDVTEIKKNIKKRRQN